MSAEQNRADKPKKGYVIHIDRKQYEVAEPQLTGTQIRQLAGLGSEVDLYLEQHGNEDDRQIADGDSVDLKNGMHFFSTPRHITPGRV